MLCVLGADMTDRCPKGQIIINRLIIVYVVPPFINLIRVQLYIFSKSEIFLTVSYFTECKP